MIKVIPTRYKGILFRSRTEARWAVFFDEIGYEWEYEKEGFELPSGRYLPDFYFPKLQTYLEVKGQDFTEREIQKCVELSADYMVILLDGPPKLKVYKMYEKTEEMCPVVFVPVGDKYWPFFFTYDIDPIYFQDTLECVQAAQTYRF